MEDGYLSIWVDGLSPEADAGNTIVEVQGVPHFPQFVLGESGQINVQLRPVIGEGTHDVRVLHRGASTQSLKVQVKGNAQPIGNYASR